MLQFTADLVAAFYEFWIQFDENELKIQFDWTKMNNFWAITAVADWCTG